MNIKDIKKILRIIIILIVIFFIYQLIINFIITKHNKKYEIKNNKTKFKVEEFYKKKRNTEYMNF